MRIISNKERKLDKKNDKPLIYSLNNNLNEIAEILISKGADITAKDIIFLEIIIKF